MRVFGASNQGFVRANNEDAFYIDEKKGLLIIADGMGGHAGGEEASRLAVQTVVENLGEEYLSPPDQAVRAAILAANEAVLAKSVSDPVLAGMGTTLTLVLVLPDYLITGQIGDSGAYIIDKAEARCLTGDHSVSGQLLATGKITPTEAGKHPQRHVLTRSLGTGAELEVEVLCHSWSPGQHLLLCSDGLTEVVETAEIFAAVRGHGDLKEKVKGLIRLVLERGAPDNVTIILAQL